MREKVGNSRNTVFFQWFVAPEGRKVGSLKAAGAEPAGQMSDEKLHAVVARSTFRSQNVQNTPLSDHFWKLQCRKSARRCGAKHISKWKCTKHTILGPLLEVEMSKKCTPLWREAHFQVKMYKTHHSWTTFGSWDVQKVHAAVARSTFRSQNVQTHQLRTTFGSWDAEKVHAVVARSTFRSQNVQNTRVRTTFGGSDVEKVHAVLARSTFRSQNVKNSRGSDHFWRFRCRFAYYTTTTQLHSTPLQLQLQLHNYTPLQYTPLH